MIEPPFIMKESKRVSVGRPACIFSGSHVIIDCNIINGTPPITILWFHNNEVINSSEGNSSTITITDAEDGDVFTCRADNYIGFDVASSIINVKVGKEYCEVILFTIIYVAIILMNSASIDIRINLQ